MANRFRISGAMVRRLDDIGIAREAVLLHAGLPASLFDQGRAFVSTEEFFAIHRAIEAVANDPAIGLKIGTEDRIERYDPIAIAAVYARSFRDALERMSRYKQLTCPENINVIERGSECRVHFDFLLAEADEPVTLVDLCFAWVLGIARRGTGTPVKPNRLELKREGNAALRAMYEGHFGCAVKFGAKQNLLVFDAAVLDRVFVTHNADVLAIVAPQLEAELREQQAGRTFREQVKATLKKILAGRRPELREVARELRVSTRTLQRRLTEERVTFQQLIAEARRELAQHYLLHSQLELNETAYLLGYEDANSFFRAFHQWEGTSPGEWRATRSEQAAQVA